MGLLYFLIVGAVSGWLATEIMGGKKKKLVWNIVLGLVGSIVGGYLAGILGIGGGTIAQIIIAVAGSCLVIWLSRKISK